MSCKDSFHRNYNAESSESRIVLKNFSSAYYNVVERYFPYGNRKLNHGTMRKCWATSHPRITMSCKDSFHRNYSTRLCENCIVFIKVSSAYHNVTVILFL